MTHAGRRPVGPAETVRAQRSWWDREAEAYYAEHGDFLGDDGFVWGPEGWTETELGLLDPAGMPPGPLLEIGAGAAQCSRWLAASGRTVVASDLSGGMLARARAIDRARARPLPLIQCDGARLPFADAGFAAVFTSYGVLPFVADSSAVLGEAARVLLPGGRFVAAFSHPIRWAFPDVPGEAGLTVAHSYFDTTPYAETDDRGRVTYVEHHRTLGQLVREIVAAGLDLLDLLEPAWPTRNDATWGGWSPLRGELIPGTAIVVARKRRETPGAQVAAGASRAPGWCASGTTAAPHRAGGG